MYKLIGIILVLIIPLNAMAQYSSWRGAYFGVIVGITWADYQHYRFVPGEKPERIVDLGVGPLFHLGYNINKNFSFELGAAYLRKTVFQNIAGSFNNGRFKNNVVYLTARGAKLFQHGIRCFVKLGIGYVVRDEIINNAVVIVESGMFVRPVYGVGLGWHFRRNWETEFSWLQTASMSRKQLPTSNHLGIGVNYLF